MLGSLYTSVSAMSSIQVSQSVTTNNIANSNTVGYKSDVVQLKPFDDVVISNTDNFKKGKGTYNELGTLNWGVRVDEVATNQMQGKMVSTERPLDFAIDGDGLFTVIDAKKNVYYTRDGVMSVDKEGYMVNSSGYRVLGTNVKKGGMLEPIKIDKEEISLDGTNTLSVDGKALYNFKIVHFEDTKNMKRVGTNLYKGEGVVDSKDFTIKQNMQELSNVDILEETTNLMTNLKMYEANQRVIQQIDSILNKIANEVGRV